MSLEPIPCATCGRSDAGVLCTKFDLPIARCRGCGLVYATPRLSPAEVARRYSPDYFWNEYLPAVGVVDGRYDLDFFDRRHAAMLRLIAQVHSPPGGLLEVGAGAGFFMKAAERAGWRVSGVEVSEAAAAFARERLGLDVSTTRAEQMQVPAGAFDVVVMFDVIEHLFEPARVLRAVRAATRRGGLIVISTPNVDALSRHALGRAWAVWSPAEHLYYFSETSLKAILHQAGFGDVRYVRRYEGHGVFETMNPRYTHSPGGLRARVYHGLVTLLGPAVYRRIQDLGRADSLVCVALAA